ncbi:MAG: hypothetical protein ABFD18_12895 [Syntrophomonas sp.]
MRKKLFSYLLIFSLLLSVFALAGCATKKEAVKEEAPSLKGTTIKVMMDSPRYLPLLRRIPV